MNRGGPYPHREREVLTALKVAGVPKIDLCLATGEIDCLPNAAVIEKHIAKHHLAVVMAPRGIRQVAVEG